MADHTIEFGPFRLENGIVYDSRNNQLELPDQTVKVLRVLLEHTLHHGQTALSSADLRHQVWGHQEVSPNNLHQHINRLRKACGAAALVSTSGPRGYRLTLPVRWSGPASNMRWRALAVLPFVCPPGYFSDEARLRLSGYHLALGISHALRQITSLEIREIGPQYLQPGWQPNAAQCAREQQTDLVLTGHLTAEPTTDELRLQLIEAKNNSVLWSGKFAANLTDSAAVEQHIACQIAGALGFPPSVVTAKRAPHPEAVAHYRRGAYLFGTQWGLMDEALQEFTYALTLDPQYAEPWVGIAEIWMVRCAFTPAINSPQEGVPKILAATQRALELDPHCSAAHNMRGAVAFFWEWNWELAEHHFRKAIEYGPDNFFPHILLGRLLVITNRNVDEGLRYAERGRELAPHLIYGVSVVAWIYYFAGRPDKGIALCRELLAQFPTFQPPLTIGSFSLLALGKVEEAIERAQTSVKHGENLVALSMLGYMYGQLGRTDEAEQILQEFTERKQQVYVSPYHFALVHTGLGNYQTALDFLDAALQERSEWLTHLLVDHRLRPLHQEARFRALLAHVGLGDGHGCNHVVLSRFSSD